MSCWPSSLHVSFVRVSAKKNSPLGALKLYGLTPHWRHSEADEYALYGISIRRGNEPYGIPITPRQALADLEASPDIERIHRKVFPFNTL